MRAEGRVGYAVKAAVRQIKTPRGSLGDGVVLLKLTELVDAGAAYVLIEELNEILTATAEAAYGNVLLDDNGIVLDEYFNRCIFNEALFVAYLLRDNEAAELIYVSYYSCRFHIISLCFLYCSTVPSC